MNKQSKEQKSMDDYDNLKSDSILIAEFNYAASSASQANEDRIKVFNFFLANIGTIIAAFAIPNIANSVGYLFFSFLFFLLSIFGFISLLQLVKIRLSWVDSAKAMNQIKDYYVKVLKQEELIKAFRWHTNSVPKANKIWSVAFLIALTLMILNSLAFVGGMTFLTFQYLGQTSNLFLLAVTTFIVMLIAQFLIWFKLLNPSKK